ncbi:MAG TPA: polysaccharide lyase family 7 protein [Aeromicrobium sp.]|nr:polysaccharide lyase family 7 protein [Aeromicrobium sp.]HKY57318.1 polysaccharide lyase family 7 protein [Aeromicrobium sp.]
MTWGKSVLLTIPLILSGIFVVPSPASAKDFLDTDWKGVSAGGAHACAIASSSKLYCWGNDDHGQLGNTDVFNSKTTPNEVKGGTGWTVVSAGDAHTCGIRSGRLYCWGSDSDGRLGNTGSYINDKGTPQQIGSLADWRTVSAGGAHTCAIRSSRYYLYCWGDDSRGQIGDGTNSIDRAFPTLVAGTYSGWKSVSAGGTHTCAIRTNGRLYCWGDDSLGQMGNGSVGKKTYPYPVSATATDWRAVSAGGSHSCAIRTNGYLYCWGDDSRGQLGNGSAGSATYPRLVGSGWTQISAGAAHTCGMRSARLQCWGDNEHGQAAAASEDLMFPSPQIQAGSWKTQDAGERHSCGVKGDGTLNCWGVPEPPPVDDCPTDQPTNVYAGDAWQDLGYWKLTTPVDGSDSNSTADEVKQPALETLDGKDYFDRLTDPGNPIRFRASVDGATTSGSSYPRSELREMTQDGQYNRAAWSSKCGTHTMTIEQAITQLPGGKDEVVAGQIHDSGVDGGTGDVIMIRLEGTRLFVEGDNKEYGELDGSYELGQRFTVQVTAENGKISVRYQKGDAVENIAPFSPSVDNEQWYFKAGCYTQANESNGTGAGEVVIYDLDVTHEPPA